MLPILAVLALSACAATPGDSGLKDQAPRTVKEGATFTIGKYSVAKGWKLANDGVGGFAAEGVTVKNTSDDVDTAYFRLKVFAGSKVLAEIDCNTSEIEAGQEQDANCLDTGLGNLRVPRRPYTTGWDKITVESNSA
jgi:hypothetical protein